MIVGGVRNKLQDGTKSIYLPLYLADLFLNAKRLKSRIGLAVNGTPSHSCGVSLSIWNHTVLLNEHTRFNPSQTDRYSIYVPRRDTRLS